MIDQIAPPDFAKWLTDVATAHPTRQAVLLDVREPHELQSASVGSGTANPAYRLVTIPLALVPLRLAELNPEQPTACLCHHGVRSMQVARFLASRGFADVVNIAGGIDAWATQVDPSIGWYQG
jgi:rhodanese-related sulfurtransferase